MMLVAGSVSNYVKIMAQNSKIMKAFSGQDKDNQAQKAQNGEIKVIHSGPAATNALYKQAMASKPKNSRRVSMIFERLRRGQKLSGADLEYLRQNAPELYEKAARIIKEREALEDRVKQCKSKEELHAVKITALSTVITDDGDSDSAHIRTAQIGDVFAKNTKKYDKKTKKESDGVSEKPVKI